MNLRQRNKKKSIILKIDAYESKTNVDNTQTHVPKHTHTHLPTNENLRCRLFVLGSNSGQLGVIQQLHVVRLDLETSVTRRGDTGAKRIKSRSKRFKARNI